MTSNGPTPTPADWDGPYHPDTRIWLKRAREACTPYSEDEKMWLASELARREEELSEYEQEERLKDEAARLRRGESG